MQHIDAMCKNRLLINHIAINFYEMFPLGLIWRTRLINVKIDGPTRKTRPLKIRSGHVFGVEATFSYIFAQLLSCLIIGWYILSAGMPSDRRNIHGFSRTDSQIQQR